MHYGVSGATLTPSNRWISSTVTVRLFKTKSCTSAIISGVMTRLACPGRASSSSNSRPSRNLLRHSTTVERLRLYSPYTAFIRRYISRPPTPSAAKNRITPRCSFLLACMFRSGR
ncbi:hypothetical protein AVEN_9704-1 [Araneus ventricosus]|uniref:Uncharacterized protein n=1 Tax=Araneus ventricosus TaxID=182803 RepID=A0A4Y2DXC5_ARAVE|nr:hypothetical protein AVEN_9704-1 [Araneus ventricosus]